MRNGTVWAVCSDQDDCEAREWCCLEGYHKGLDPHTRYCCCSPMSGLKGDNCDEVTSYSRATLAVAIGVFLVLLYAEVVQLQLAIEFLLTKRVKAWSSLGMTVICTTLTLALNLIDTGGTIANTTMLDRDFSFRVASAMYLIPLGFLFVTLSQLGMAFVWLDAAQQHYQINFIRLRRVLLALAIASPVLAFVGIIQSDLMLAVVVSLATLVVMPVIHKVATHHLHVAVKLKQIRREQFISDVIHNADSVTRVVIVLSFLAFLTMSLYLLGVYLITDRSYSYQILWNGQLILRIWIALVCLKLRSASLRVLRFAVATASKISPKSRKPLPSPPQKRVVVVRPIVPSSADSTSHGDVTLEGWGSAKRSGHNEFKNNSQSGHN